MAKLTLEEKRRQSIYRQLYGKQSSSPVKVEEVSKPQTPTNQISLNQKASPIQKTQAIDSKYLKNDLQKVLMLSTAAIAIQLLLFFAQRNHLINFY